MKTKRKSISFVLLALFLLGLSVIPGQAEDNSPPELNLTLDQAVELAVENSPQVGLADVNRKVTSITYSQYRKVANDLKDKGMKVPVDVDNDGKNDITVEIDRLHVYAENELQYLKPQIAKRQEEQAEIVYNIAISGVKIQAENAFYNLLKAQQSRKIAENALQRADEGLKIVKAKYEVGTAAKIEVLKAETIQAGNRAALVAAQNDYKQKMLELNKTLEIDMDTQVNPQGAFEFQKEEFDLTGMLDKAKNEEKSIIEAADNYQIAVWQYDFLKLNKGNRAWDTRRGEQAMIAAELGFKQAQDNVVTKVNQTYLNCLALEEQYQYLQKAVDLSSEAYRLKKLSYEVGMATFEEVEQASDDVFKAETAVSECIYNYNMVKASLKNNIYI